MLCLSSGMFLFVVLYFYEGFGIPAGISYSGHGLLFRAACFGLMAGVLYFLNEWLIRPRFQISTFRQRIFWYLWEIVVVWHFTFLLINIFWHWDNLSWFGYFDLLGELSSVLIFPVLFTELMMKKQSGSVPGSSVNKMLLFRSENEKEQVQVLSDDLLYITSEDNYIDIYFRQDGEVRHKTIRSSLKRVEEEFRDSPYIVRCHRSYMINPYQVIHLSASSRGNTVVMPNTIKLPVSDTYLPEIRDKMPGSDSSRI